MLKTSTTVLWMGAAWGLALLGATQATADPCHESGKCTATDAGSGDRFGDAVAIDGTVAVMGAPYDDDNGLESGSAYIFHFDGSDWIQQPKLAITGAGAGDFCGYSASISGNAAI
ncbi:MAG: FG-GAP repeat protein, partial [Planctomycetota bacterium]